MQTRSAETVTTLIAIREFFISRKNLGGIQTDLQSRSLLSI